MSQLIQAGSTVARTIQLSEELRWLHRQITERGLPVSLCDDFYGQGKELEAFAGGDGFTRTHARARLWNRLSGVLALPVLLGVIAAIAADKLVDGFHLFDWMFANPWVFVIAGVLLVGVLVAAALTRSANSALLRREYPALVIRAGLVDEPASSGN